MRRMIGAVFILLSFLTFSQELIKVPIDVENDRWIISDYEIPNWGKERYFYGSSSLNAWNFEPSFVPEREYKIKGGFGWEVVFYLSEKGGIEIKKVNKGPYLKNKPIVKVIESKNKTKRIRIMMSDWIEVNFNIPFEYGSYRTNVFDRNYKGGKTFQFPEGDYTFEFEDGLSFVLSVRKNNCNIKNISKGGFIFDENRIKIDRKGDLFLIDFPVPENIYKVEFEIPIYLYPLISKTYHLPGRYKISGKLGWNVEYEVNRDGVKILDIDKGLILDNLQVKSEKFKIIADCDNLSTVFFTSQKNENLNISNFMNWYELSNYNISDGELKVAGFYLPAGRYKFGNINFPLKDAKFTSIGVMKNCGLIVKIKDDYWISKEKVRINCKIKGKLLNPCLTVFIKKYNSDWDSSIKIYEGKFGNEIKFVLPDLEFENYTLRFTLKEKETSRNPKDYDICAEIPYFPFVSKGYKVYLFTKENQKYFYQGKEIEFYVNIKKYGNPKDRYLEILLDDGKKEKIIKKINLVREFRGNKNRKKLNFVLSTSNLKAGEYRIIAKIGKISDFCKVNLVDSVPKTNFIIHAYGGEINEEVISELSEIGVNCQINNGAISSGWINKRRTSRLDFILDTSLKNPYLVPLEKLISKSKIRKYYEDLIKNRIKLIAQYGCAHQFFHYSTCFMDPEIQKTIARDISLYLQIIKNYSVLYGINLGDEAGTPRGPTEWDDHCNICMEIFSKENKIDIPFNIWDIEKWREYIVQDELWKKYYYFKQIQMPSLIKYVKKENDRILQLPYHTQGGNLNYFSIDGGYPPISNEPYGFNTAHWYPHYGSTLWNLIGVEFMKMGPKRIPYLPLIWSCDDFYTTRHEVYLCLLDGVDGIGHFHISSAVGNTTVKEPDQKELLKKDVHPKLIKFGDLFLKLKPKKEIAVLFSFTQQLDDLKDCFAGRNAIGSYAPAYRQVQRAGMCFLTLWRAHYPSSIISEEDIKKGKLNDYKILFITGVKKMPEKIKEEIEKFIEKGGKVFIDKETEINIKGAEKLNFDFSSWYFYTQGIWERTEKHKEFFPVDFPFTIPLIPKMEKLVSSYVKKEFDSSSPFLIVSSLKAGDIEYILCVNDAQLEYEKRKNPIISEFLPLKTDLKIFKEGFLFDLTENREIGNRKINLEIAPGDIKVYCILKEKIGSIKLKVEKGNLIVNIFSENNKKIKGSIPFEINYIEDSKITKKIYRATDENGNYQEKLYVYSNSNFPVKITVKELISNKKEEILIKKPLISKDVLCKQRKRANFLKAIRNFIDEYKNDEIWVIYGDEKEKNLAKKVIVPYLVKNKVKYQLFECDILPFKEYPHLLGRGIARTPLGVPSYYYPLNLKIENPVILIGTPFTNKIVRELVKSEVVPDCSEEGDYYIVRVFKIFDFDYDSLIIASFEKF